MVDCEKLHDVQDTVGAIAWCGPSDIAAGVSRLVVVRPSLLTPFKTTLSVAVYY